MYTMYTISDSAKNTIFKKTYDEANFVAHYSSWLCRGDKDLNYYKGCLDSMMSLIKVMGLYDEYLAYVDAREAV